MSRQPNVVPEGALAGMTVSVQISESCRDIPTGAVSVAQLDSMTLPPLGVQAWLSSTVFQPATIVAQQRTLLKPLEISFAPRAPLHLYVDRYGARGAEKVVETVNARVTLRDRRGEIHQLKKDRFTLHFARAVLPMLKQALRSVDRTNAVVGIIDAGESESGASTSMYMQWDTSSEGDILAGVAVNLWNENGARWRVVQISKDSEQTVWALDFVSFFISHTELAGPLPETNLAFELTPEFGGDTGDTRVKLATSIESVISTDCSPFENATTLRAVNLSSPLVEFSRAGTGEGNRGWVLRLQGTIGGSMPLVRELDQATVASTNSEFEMRPPGVPFVIATTDEGTTEWWAQKSTRGSKSFIFLWTILKKF